jgi:hypothetical protein
LPVFFASIGWYSNLVTNRAHAALPQIIEDPSEPLTSIIQSPSYSYKEKYSALKAIDDSLVANEKKAAVALAALAESLRAATNDLRQRRDLVETRKFSTRMIGRYGTEDASVYPLLERTYKEGEEDEKFPVVDTLAALATENAAQLLSSFLRAIMVKMDDGLMTRTDERLARAIIPALGNTRQPSAGAVLRSVRESNWTSTVKRLAAEALRKIG